MTTRASRTVYRARMQIERFAVPLFIGSVIVLMLLGYARLYEITNSVRADQHATCVASQASRQLANETIRIPLKQALNYLAQVGYQSAERPGQTTEGRATALAFADQFAAYADAVKVQPIRPC